MLENEGQQIIKEWLKEEAEKRAVKEKIKEETGGRGNKS